jgi:hypothetical protein
MQRAPSRLCAPADLNSIHSRGVTQVRLDSLQLCLARHGQHVTSLSLWGPSDGQDDDELKPRRLLRRLQ